MKSDAILDHLTAELQRQIQARGITPGYLSSYFNDLVRNLAIFARRRQVFFYRLMAQQLATGLAQNLWQTQGNFQSGL
jgi:hypothetical protein